MTFRPDDRAVLRDLEVNGPTSTLRLMFRLAGVPENSIPVGRGRTNRLRAVRTVCDQLVRRRLVKRDGTSAVRAHMWKITDAGKAWLLATETTDARLAARAEAQEEAENDRWGGGTGGITGTPPKDGWS